MITGAPINGVTAFNGITPVSPGSRQIRLHNKAMPEPINTVTGNNSRWSEDPVSNRAR